MSAPVFQALGPLKATNSTGTVTWPVHTTNDVALLLVQSANEAVTLASPQGFALLAQPGTGTGGAAGSVRLTVFWCRATSGSMPPVQIADPGQQIIARIATFRGCITTGNPWDVTANDSLTPASTTVTVPGATTTVVDCLVVAMVANALDTVTDEQVSGWANAALTSLTEQMDWNSDTGMGGGLALATGIKATAGAIGNTTATLATTSKQARVMVALKAIPSGGTGGGAGAMPVFQAAGIKAEAVGGSVSPAWPAHLTGDIALLVIESANETISLSTAAGFVQVADSPQGTGTAASITATRLAIYWCRATSSAMGAPTVADPGNHVVAQILTFRGCITTGNPWDVTSGDVQATETATVAVPGDTTTIDNCLVVLLCSDARDQSSVQYSGWANAALSSVTEIADTRTSLGNGGGFGIATGGKATAGAYGVTSASIAGSSNAVQGRISIALKPPITGGGGGGGGTLPDALPHRYWRMRLANTPGSGPKVNQVEAVERTGIAGAQGNTATAPASLHPSITHFRPAFRVNQGSDGAAVFDFDLMLVTVPAGYSPDMPTDQVTRRVDNFTYDDGVLRPGVGQNDGAGSLPLVKGVVRGTAQHGDQVTFSDFGRIFQTVPLVTLRGGILYQPASKWGTAAQVDAGTASSAPGATTPQYEDFSAKDLTESGFTCQARLRQKGTITNRSLAFAGTHLDTPNETDTIGTLTNAPSSDDRYAVGAAVVCKLKSSNATLFRVTMVVVVESTIDSGATWQQRAVGNFVFQTVNMAYGIQSSSGAFQIAVAGLTADGTDRIRIRLDHIETSGLGLYDLAFTYAAGTTVTFTTSADNFASKTPAADDVVIWEAVGYL